MLRYSLAGPPASPPPSSWPHMPPETSRLWTCSTPWPPSSRRASPAQRLLGSRPRELRERPPGQSEQRWAAAQPAGPIDGVPVTVKENLARAGVPMPAGNAGVEPVVPTRSCPVVERVARGRRRHPRLHGHAGLGHALLRRLEPARDHAQPWNTALTTGGSSSGAGAAAAGGLRAAPRRHRHRRLHPAPGHLAGPDHPQAQRRAGTARHALPRPGGRPADPHGARRGPADVGHQPPRLRDWTSLPPRGPRTVLAVDHATSAACAWVCISTPAAGCRASPRCAGPSRRPPRSSREAGAVVEPLPPFMTPSMLARPRRVLAGAVAGRLPGADAGASVRVLPFIRRWVPAARDVDGTTVLRYYQQHHGASSRPTVAATEPYDLVLSPVAPVTAFPAEWPMPFGDEDRGMAHIGFTAPYNMSGQPAASVNCGFTGDGRTIGLQVPGRRFDDVGVLGCRRLVRGAPPGAGSPDWPVRASAGPTATGVRVARAWGGRMAEPTAARRAHGPRLRAGAPGPALRAHRRAGRGGDRERRAQAGPAAAERARAGRAVRRQPAHRARGPAGAGEQRRSSARARATRTARRSCPSHRPA